VQSRQLLLCDSQLRNYVYLGKAKTIWLCLSDRPPEHENHWKLKKHTNRSRQSRWYLTDECGYQHPQMLAVDRLITGIMGAKRTAYAWFEIE